MTDGIPQLEPGMYFGLDERLYHSQKHLSAHGAVDFAEHPMVFWLKSPYNPDWKYSEPTKAMVMGTAAHKLLLEPDDFRSEFCVMPYDDISLDRKATLTEAEYRRLCDMVGVIRNMPKVNRYFSGGFAEVTIVWDDPVTGLRQRTRHDYLLPFLSVDYKTTKSLSAGTIKGKMNYDADGMQSVMYQESRLVMKEMLREYFRSIDKGLKVPSPIYTGPRGGPSEEWLRRFIETDVDAVYLLYQMNARPWAAQVIRIDEDTARRSYQSLTEVRQELKYTLEHYGESGWPQCSGEAVEFSSWHGYIKKKEFA